MRSTRRRSIIDPGISIMAAETKAFFHSRPTAATTFPHASARWAKLAHTAKSGCGSGGVAGAGGGYCCEIDWWRRRGKLPCSAAARFYIFGDLRDMYHDLCPVRLRGMYRVNAASLMFEVTGAWTLICNNKVHTIVVWVSQII
ncbi:uncharacterized protein LOC119363370 [Triticum dicoccoides]|uniref:uncharacterized protein LOC119363370 n=1 Tax=Triticum dicoccoides TaxID=85692 RepID=UPI00188FD387|nr:uncharacterized protein LOC119363370 [Triticum dicoccoides]